MGASLQCTVPIKLVIDSFSSVLLSPLEDLKTCRVFCVSKINILFPILWTVCFYGLVRILSWTGRRCSLAFFNSFWSLKHIFLCLSLSVFFSLCETNISIFHEMRIKERKVKRKSFAATSFDANLSEFYFLFPSNLFRSLDTYVCARILCTEEKASRPRSHTRTLTPHTQSYAHMIAMNRNSDIKFT